MITVAASSGEPPSPISLLPDDLLLKNLSMLPSATDPRLLPRLSGVSRRFRRLLRSPLPSSLPMPLPSSLSLSYPTLHKLTVCCPGLLHAGVLIAHFSLDCDFSDPRPNQSSLFYPLHNAAHDTNSTNLVPADTNTGDCAEDELDCSSSNQPQNFTDTLSSKMRMKPFWREKSMGPPGSHLTSGNWSLSRKHGSRLLASAFRGDSLYICDWPGCVHREGKRNYMLFRGVFEDFNKSRVWRKIMDSKWGKIKLDCAYCTCNEMWDLQLTGCLAGIIEFHGDGEPLVRAFVCDNGHVSGAWTERRRLKFRNLNMTMSSYSRRARRTGA